ncbi:MAG: hypothetical protein LBP59_19495 [Planctomycetaceae bacterium]|jgi:uncharacterized protein (TIGR03546 family)|nr:hypothetical protein [Planctomycetaceae bacterium]
MNRITGNFGAYEIALSVSFGVMLGLLLLTSGKFLFFILLLLFLFSGANLFSGIIVTIIISALTIWFHSTICHSVGEIILMNNIFQNVCGVLFKLPFFAWTMLDNTIVCGSFAIGLILFLPLFVIAWIPLKLLLPKQKKQTQNKTQNPSINNSFNI